MAEYQTTNELNQKIEILKHRYEFTKANKNTLMSEEELQDENLRQKMESFTSLLHNKMGQVKQIHSTLEGLNKYKDALTDLLTDIKNTEQKYIKLYEQNSLNQLDIKLEKPLPAPAAPDLLLPEKLCIDFSQRIIEDIYIEMKRRSFMTIPSYIHNMCDVVEKVNIKIIEENAKLVVLTDFIRTYRDILSSCTDKTVLNRFKCTICYDEEVKMCMNPCGHTFCKKCAVRSKTNCFVCNGRILSKTTLFFLGKEEEDDDAPSLKSGTDPVPYTEPIRGFLRCGFLR